MHNMSLCTITVDGLNFSNVIALVQSLDRGCILCMPCHTTPHNIIKTYLKRPGLNLASIDLSDTSIFFFIV